jgi:hypothetical protein
MSVIVLSRAGRGCSGLALWIVVVYWVLAAIFLSIALAVPRWRPIGIVGSVLLGLMLGWAMLQRLRATSSDEIRGSPSSPAAAVVVFPLDALDAEELRLLGSGAPFELRGRISNKSPLHRLRSFTVEITRSDCYEGALDPSGCVVQWRTRQWVELSLEPGQTREFANTFWSRGDVPRARGTLRDTIKLVAADGQSAN